MKMTRRQLAAAGALAFGTSSLLRSAPSLAESVETGRRQSGRSA